MSQDSVIDSLSCILLKVLGFFIRFLPIRFSLFLGRRIGDLLYCFDLKHRSIAYSNIKTAFGDTRDPPQIRRLTHEFYQSFGQNLIEIFFIPSLTRAHVKKYVCIEGRSFIDEAFSVGKGVIFLSVHAGSWELSSVICASLGFDFNLLVRDQRYPRLNELLNKYRRHRGCKIIQRESQTRNLVKALKTNEAIGMTMDQGGKDGSLVRFFGKEASMATGAIRLALKYDCQIVPGYYTRVKGPYIKAILRAPFRVKKSGNLEKDIHDNLQELVYLFEKDIERFPRDYLWFYKIWKYGRTRRVLILSDGKAGHLRQSEALLQILSRHLQEHGMAPEAETLQVKFKNAWAEKGFRFAGCLSGKYQCQGCLGCLKTLLQKDNYDSLSRARPDIIISCGSSVELVNYILSRENKAKSIVLMRPMLLGTSRFDLAIIPGHDRPQKRKSIVITQGAPNLIDKEYLTVQAARLKEASGLALSEKNLYLGFFIGGDTKAFRLTKETLSGVLRQVGSAAKKLDAEILVTTSRRTSKESEELVKNEWGHDPRCKFLVVANEKNIPEAVGGILGLSQIVICTPESFSMVSEAISSQRYVFVFNARGLRQKHRRYLNHFSRKGYLYLTEIEDLGQKIEEVWANQPPIQAPNDTLLIKEAIKKII
ncbi:MAG: ELM1/GtrOC1 family putative glycosyltransferase [Candidatus Omnitrophota bacterium]